MRTLVATAVVLAASVAASASNAAVQFQGAMLMESIDFVPDPDRCGPSGLAGSATYKGRDTLGGAFDYSVSYCVAPAEPGTGWVFDQQGSGSYLLTGETWTAHLEDFLVISIPPPVCAELPEKPVSFTFDDFTGEHAGGRAIGLANYIWRSAICASIFPDEPVIIWFEGVFTPKAPRCGLGWELVLLLPPLMWLHRRSKKLVKT